ncbi:MAG: glycosyltransferase [Pleurocapsa sp. MO_192.B19]|nr:glycosyltransferase [Pleurocapsa sp. MO_192.B19]
MSSLKLLFFVNGSEASAAGVRANMFAQRLPSEWQIRFNYRPTPKWKGIIPFIQSALHFRPDLIYVMDTAYTGVLAGSIAKRLIGCKLITDTGDVAYELAKSSGSYSKQQLALINWIEQMAITNSDCLVVRGSYHKSWLEKQGVHNVVFVPDGVDMNAVKPVDATAIKTELGLDNHLVVGMVGTMTWSERHQMCYGWDIIEALGLLKDMPVNALLVGDGDGRTILENRVQQLGIASRVVFTGRIPYEDLPRYLSAMDVCVSTQSNDLVGMVRTTGKLPLYLAYGKYVVATDVGEAKKVLPGVGCLLTYTGVRDDTHPSRLATQLEKLVDKPQHLQIAEKARQAAQDDFDYQMLAKRVEKVCRDLVGMKHN